MDFTVEQIQALKKEIEGIWTHLNNIEKQLTEGQKTEQNRFSRSADETIEMLERMKRKVETTEQQAQQTVSDDLDQRIDQALLQDSVKNALQKLKQQLGIG